MTSLEDRVDAAAAELTRWLIERLPDEHGQVEAVIGRESDGRSSSFHASVDLPGNAFRQAAPLMTAIQELAGLPTSSMLVTLVARRDRSWDLAAAWEDGLDEGHWGLTRVLEPGARPATPPNFPSVFPLVVADHAEPGGPSESAGPASPEIEPSGRNTQGPGLSAGLGARLRRLFGQRPQGSVPSPAESFAAERTDEVDLDGIRDHVEAALPAYATVRPPATEDQLAALESAVGTALPDEFRAVYRIADGGELDYTSESTGIHGHYGWMSVAQILHDHAWTQQHPWFGWSLGWNESRLESEPYGAVRRAGGDPGWVPLFDDGGGNWIGLDLNPAAGGRVGQVIRFGRDYPTAVYVAPTLTALFRGDEHPRVRSSVMLRAEQLRAFAQAPGGQEAADDPASFDKALTVLVAQEPALQELRLFDLPQVGLTPLARLPRLRVLLLHSPGADLSPLRDVPLESISLGAEADLAGLAGHHTLARITLRHAADADLSVLATLPALTGIDLGDSPDLDITALGDDVWSTIEYARLHHDQWHRLLEAGRQAPRPAALTIAGAPTLADALDTARRFDRPDRTLSDTRLARSSAAH